MHPNKTTLMGILNLTPDSFYDGGKYNSKKYLLHHLPSFKMADIIDVGCESSRPQSHRISEDEEMSRLSVFFENFDEIKKINSKCLFSIDSYKKNIIKFCLSNGFNIINDITGGGESFENIELAIEYDVPIILMHMQGIPCNMQDSPNYNNVVDELKFFFEKKINFALNNGLKEKNIILDPGIGFGKTIKDNDNIIINLNEFKKMGFDLLIGISRKSFLSSNKKDPESLLHASLGVLALSIMNGADIVRVHDIAETKQLTSIIDRMKYNL